MHRYYAEHVNFTETLSARSPTSLIVDIRATEDDGRNSRHYECRFNTYI